MLPSVIARVVRRARGARLRSGTLAAFLALSMMVNLQCGDTDDSAEKRAAESTTQAATATAPRPAEDQRAQGPSSKKTDQAVPSNPRRRPRSTYSPAPPPVADPDATAPGKGNRNGQSPDNDLRFVQPPRPRARTVPAGHGCAIQEVRDGASVKQVKAPPRPGLTASLDGDTLRVRVDTGQAEKECKPVGIRDLPRLALGSHPTASPAYARTDARPRGNDDQAPAVPTTP